MLVQTGVVIVLIRLIASCGAMEEISGVLPNSGKLRDSSANPTKQDHDVESVEDSVLHLLLAALSPLTQFAEKPKSTDGVPPVELEKLKASAKSAGLSEPKASRVSRAVSMLNLGYHDIKVLRRAYLDPDTSAEYGNYMRTALERRCIEEDLRRNAPAEGSPSDMYQRLKTAAKLSGLTDKEVDGFTNVVAAMRLTPAQLTRLEDAIVHHGPGPVDMKKLGEQLLLLRKSRSPEQDSAWWS